MKKYLSLAFLLFVPFLTNAQQAPELYITNLSIEKTNYQLGETITGSFVLGSLSQFGVPDIYYDISLGEISEGGSNLINIVDSSEPFGPIYVDSNSMQTISFEYTPEFKVEGNLGIQVTIKTKNGGQLSWAALPINLSGEASELIGAMLFIDVEKGINYFPLFLSPVVSEDNNLYLLINSENIKEGDLVNIEIYEKDFDSELVFSDNLVVEQVVEDRVGVMLPKDLDPQKYVGRAKSDNILTIKFKYIVGGLQGEILSVNSSKLKVEKKEDFEVDILYGGVPLDINQTEEVTEKLERARIEVIVTDENGKEVARESKTKEAENTVDGDLVLDNLFEEKLLLKASAKANKLNIDVKLYDDVSGELLDEHTTTLPFREDENEGLFTLANTIILLIILVAIWGIVKLFGLKSKIPTVCLAIVLLTASTIYFTGSKANALEFVYGPAAYTGGLLIAGSPLEHGVDGYDPGEMVDISVGVYNWYDDTSGWLVNMAFLPNSNNWHNFTSVQQAADHIWGNEPSVAFEGNVFNDPQPEGAVRYINSWVVPQSNEHYTTKLASFDAAEVEFLQTPYLNQVIQMPQEPGIYYLPMASRVRTQYTAGLSTIDKAFVQKVCVKGAGLCAGEEVLTCQANPAQPRIGEDVTYTLTYEDPFGEINGERIWRIDWWDWYAGWNTGLYNNPYHKQSWSYEDDALVFATKYIPQGAIDGNYFGNYINGNQVEVSMIFPPTASTVCAPPIPQYPISCSLVSGSLELGQPVTYRANIDAPGGADIEYYWDQSVRYNASTYLLDMSQANEGGQEYTTTYNGSPAKLFAIVNSYPHPYNPSDGSYIDPITCTLGGESADLCPFKNGAPDPEVQTIMPVGFEDPDGNGNCTTTGVPNDDLCLFKNSVPDPEVQTTMPAGFEDPDGDKNCTTKGDPEDLCHYIDGEPDYLEIQTEIPSYLEDPDGDKNCTTKIDDPVLSVSCSPSESDFTVSNSISGETQTTFSANVVGATGAVTYKWEDEFGTEVSAGATYLFEGNGKSVGTYKYKVTVTDGGDNSATSPLCSINVTPDGTNDAPTINSLNINPVVEPCGIAFEAGGVDSCTINNNSFSSDGTGVINRTVQVYSGTYYLTCSGNGVDVTGGPIICISNPDVIER